MLRTSGPQGSCLAGILLLTGAVAAADDKRESAQPEIRSVVDRYVRSIDAADVALARQVWAEQDDISFIHPLGHEEGWAQIEKNVYRELMGGLFSTRKLTIRKIVIKRHGTTAVVEFYWEFDATWRKGGAALKTQGRETQVLLRDRKGAWRIAHIHYSGMPTTNTRQGL